MIHTDDCTSNVTCELQSCLFICLSQGSHGSRIQQQTLVQILPRHKECRKCTKPKFLLCCTKSPTVCTHVHIQVRKWGQYMMLKSIHLFALPILLITVALHCSSSSWGLNSNKASISHTFLKATNLNYTHRGWSRDHNSFTESNKSSEIKSGNIGNWKMVHTHSGVTAAVSWHISDNTGRQWQGQLQRLWCHQ